MVFALYQLPPKRGNQQFIGLEALNFIIRYQKTDSRIPLHDISKVVLEKRRKLIPLVAGGVITSLSMLSILLYSSSLDVVGLAAAGLLLTYYGMQEYVVIHLEHSSNTSLIWLPARVTLAGIRPLIAMVEYFINKQHFPVVFASTADNARLIHDESQPVKAPKLIYFRFRNLQNPEIQQVAVNPVLLDSAIEIEANEDIIGTGKYLINRGALLGGNTISYS